MDYEIRHLLADEAAGVVLVERSETWHFPSGATPTLRVMCTIELDGDKVARWREYWNGDGAHGPDAARVLRGHRRRRRRT